MPQSSSSNLSRRLTKEEAQWVFDLGSHPGFQLYQLALQELLSQRFHLLRTQREKEQYLVNTGHLDGLEAALKLPKILLEGHE